jgi:hypothetical protein
LKPPCLVTILTNLSLPGLFEAFTSTYATDELKKAQEPRRSNLLGLIDKYGVTVLETSGEIVELAEYYMATTMIPRKKRIDALHIAVASVNSLDMILTYNFHHINKLKTKTMLPTVNRNKGYGELVIVQPEEVIDYETDY